MWLICLNVEHEDVITNTKMFIWTNAMWQVTVY